MVGTFSLSFRPRLVDAIKGYRTGDFISDLSSGITVGVVALPLAMAFAIASGLKPEAGIFTAIIAGLLISLFGGSKVQIGGPAGAFIVIVYGIVAHFGVSGLIIATLMAGVLLLLMGIFRLGSLVRFVPVSIVVGFTNGIAVLIAFTQIKDLLGLKIEKMPSDFVHQVGTIGASLNTYNPYAIALAAASAVIVFGWPHLVKIKVFSFLRRIPGSIIALAAGTAAVSVMGLPVETIGTKFGGIPSALPSMTIPDVNFETIKELIPSALTLAVLGAIESLLCARVADGLINDRHNPNQELIAQGLANLAAPLFGGFAATGTIARTVTNIRSGGKTPIAGIIHAITLLIIIMVAAPLAKNIPLATLGAILLFVAYNMGEWHAFIRMRNLPRTYRVIMLTTFALTVAIDLTVAFQFGFILACIFFMSRISRLTCFDPVSELEAYGHAKIGDKIEAYTLSGALFFGAVHKVENLIVPTKKAPEVMILDLTRLMSTDMSGLEALHSVAKQLSEKGCKLLIAGASGQPHRWMTKYGFIKKLGKDSFFPTLQAALDHAAAKIGQTEAKGDAAIYD